MHKPGSLSEREPGLHSRRVLARTFMTHGEAQKSKAEAFRKLHRGSRILLLPNIWDAASARTLEESGFDAIATSSAGIAFSLGYADGQRISRSEMLEAVARIVRAVTVPVTADVEAGYGDRPEDAALTASGVIAAGAVGMNMEDSRDDPSQPLIDLTLAVEKIRAVREVALATQVPIVLNARTDVYLAEVGDPQCRYDETVRRLAGYRDAGADCLFAPGIRDVPTIQRLVRDLKSPLNILAGPGFPSVPELQKLGVARVSLGSGPMRATLGLLKRIAEELKSSGSYKLMKEAPSHADTNRLMGKFSNPD